MRVKQPRRQVACRRCLTRHNQRLFSRRPDLSEHGQMTVEFMVALPVLIVVALIAVNALTFFGDCAAFDNAFREAVRVNASSPAYGQDTSQCVALVKANLDRGFERENVHVKVAAEGAAGGTTAFQGTLEYAPTLFGLGLRQEVLGVQLPNLQHSVQLSVDCYKPGVLF